jgi:hypothetical protein
VYDGASVLVDGHDRIGAVCDGEIGGPVDGHVPIGAV